MNDEVWNEFCGDVKHIYEMVLENDNGETASYIPQLAKVNPELFAVSIVSVDGKIFSIGDTDERFCIQSCSKPMTYMMALKDNGMHEVSKHIGREPSGSSFNSLNFDRDNKPHNPLINAGAIMSCSMIKPKAALYNRYEYVMDTWKSIVGGKNVGYDNGVFLSEYSTAYRNRALANIMMENEVFPKDTNIGETLKLYFQTCSITMNCETMAKFAGMIANGGKTVDTKKQVFEPSIIKDILCIMYSCGMYDYSGRWSFDVGIPAKSGVSGAVFAVIPNLCGICVFSPKIDKIGNSVRGVEFFKYLVSKYTIHIFDTVVNGLERKKTIGYDIYKPDTDLLGYLCSLCKEGDCKTLQNVLDSHPSLDVDVGDYDGRRPLHIATEEDNMECIKVLLKAGGRVFVKDRWGTSPLSYAIAKKKTEIVKLFIIYTAFTYREYTTSNVLTRYMNKWTTHWKDNKVLH